MCENSVRSEAYSLLKAEIFTCFSLHLILSTFEFFALFKLKLSSI